MKKSSALISLIGIVFSMNALSSTKCIAHRGNNKDYFENSYAALYSAIELGTHGVEFDVVHTLDKIAIVMHDLNLKRVAIDKESETCPINTPISNLTYQEVTDQCLLKNGEEIPTLESFLTILAPTDLFRFIEFKDKPSEKTFTSIEKFNHLNPAKLRLISFKKKYLKIAYKKRRSSDFWKEVKLLAIYKSTLRPTKKYGINIHHSAMSYIRMIKRKGQETSVWTVDTIKGMKTAVKKEIDFITTNDPLTCIKLIDLK